MTLVSLITDYSDIYVFNIMKYMSLVLKLNLSGCKMHQSAVNAAANQTESGE